MGKSVLDDFELNIGGGIHCLPEGGFLNMHIDFNIHPITGHERVANAILYLNDNWNSDNGGNLVLWDGIKGGNQISYTPDFNRLVIFPVTEDSWHGNPDKVVNRDLRISLSMYFYDLEKSEREFHTTVYKDRSIIGTQILFKAWQRIKFLIPKSIIQWIKSK